MRNVLIAALIAVGGVMSGCAVLMPVDDGRVQTSVSQALAADPELAPIKVTVNSEGGVVRLRGEVKTFALRQKIEAKVKAVTGVKSIDNQLIITG